MITVAIISLLASIAIPMAETVVQRNREAELRVALRHMRSAIDAYKEAFDQKRILPPVGEAKPDMSGYPPDLESLYKGVPDAKDPKGAKMYFLRRLPRDPFADASLPADKTWGLRAYKSPPDDPQPGEDVYDVYSQAPGKGLNGIPYKEW